MRVVSAFFAVIGGCALAAATAIELAAGQPGDTAFGLLAAPFYVAGLVGVLTGRPSGRRVSTWLLAVGALFLANVSLSNALLDTPGTLWSSSAWVIELAADIAGNLTVAAAIGLIGLFPAGVPQTRAERRVLGAAATAAVLLPVLGLVVRPTPTDALFAWGYDSVYSPIYVPSARFLASPVDALRLTFATWIFLGLGLLYLRHRRAAAADRRLIRWLLASMLSAAIMFAALIALGYLASGPVVATAIFTLYGLTVLLVLVSLTAALSSGGMIGLDEVVRRTVAYRTLWLLIAVVYVGAATALGVFARRDLPSWAALLLVAAAALAFQPVQRQLERLADRWVFGRRLDGYQVITRFGALLESAPGPEDLLARLAAAIRDGLALRWVRVRLDVHPDVSLGSGLGSRLGRQPAETGGAPAVIDPEADVIGTAPAPLRTAPAPLGSESDGIRFAPAGIEAAAAGIGLDSAAEPAHVVPLMQADALLGHIECGPRRDGPLLEEDRRLLAHLAAQASTAVSNVRLSTELADRLAVIERQAAELTASRARLVKSTDDERRRIQRDLHDGPQQDLVVLSLNLTLARERLRRGDPRADDTLGELQAALTGLLTRLREFAHTIHPPVLADQGLLVAIEAQASRLPLEVLIEADPRLRGVRYPERIETAAWYVFAEAVTNVVKHAAASRVRVSLTQPGGLLSVEVSDDGRGFEPGVARGLGLTGLADRMAIVHGRLWVGSEPGHGTTLRADIPLPVTGLPETGLPETGLSATAAGAAAGHG